MTGSKLPSRSRGVRTSTGSQIGAERLAPGAVANVPALRHAARQMLGQLGAKRRLDHSARELRQQPPGPAMSSGSRPFSVSSNASAGMSSVSEAPGNPAGDVAQLGTIGLDNDVDSQVADEPGVLG